MYLYLLNEDEQLGFLNLCTNIVKNSHCDIEKQREIIKEYCFECNMLYIHYPEEDTPDPEESFNNSENYAKKIAVFEALLLAYSDSVLESSEADVIYNFAYSIGLNNKDYNDLKNLAKEYSDKKMNLEKAMSK